MLLGGVKVIIKFNFCARMSGQGNNTVDILTLNLVKSIHPSFNFKVHPLFLFILAAFILLIERR